MSATRWAQPRRTTTTTATSTCSSPEYGGTSCCTIAATARFEDVTDKAGIASGEWAAAGGWFDYDNDGRLDLLVVNYVQWAPETNRYCGDQAKRRQNLLPSTFFPGAARTAFTGIAATARSRMFPPAPVSWRTSARA